MNATKIIIIGGPGTGKSTLAKQIAEKRKLTHLCTDPQRLLPGGMNGTPDELDYSGPRGVGEWVERFWLGRERTVIEGVKAIDALRRYLQQAYVRRSSHICDQVIFLVDRVAKEDELPGQRRQATHVANVVEEMRQQLDNLEMWRPSDGAFARGFNIKNNA